MKKIIGTFLVILFTYMLTVNVQAVQKEELVDVNNIEIQANVPKDFKYPILINFTLQNGTNALYRLDELDNYTSKAVIPKGKHKLNFVNVVGSTENYIIKCDENLNVRDKDIQYNLKITRKFKTDNKQINKIKKPQEVKNKVIVQKPKKKEIKKDGFFKQHIYTIIIFSIVSILYVVRKVR